MNFESGGERGGGGRRWRRGTGNKVHREMEIYGSFAKWNPLLKQPSPGGREMGNVCYGAVLIAGAAFLYDKVVIYRGESR